MSTALRQRLLENLRLAGLSERTQEAYVRAFRQLAEHYWHSPDQISEEEVRNYFLHMKNIKRYARGTMTIALCGIKFFYEKTLGRDWQVIGLVRPPRSHSQPVVLSVEEVHHILHYVEPSWNQR